MRRSQVEKEIKKRYKRGDIIYGMSSGNAYKITSLHYIDFEYTIDDPDIVHSADVRCIGDSGFETTISVYRSYSKKTWARRKRKVNINNSV